MTMKELEIGKQARVLTVGGEGALRQHFLDMGILPGTELTVVRYAPMGDPIEIRIHIPASVKAANSIRKAAAIPCRTSRC